MVTNVKTSTGGVILATDWMTHMDILIGVVLVEFERYTVAYVGVASGFDSTDDALHIAETGDKLSRLTAEAYFPSHNLDNYKTN